VPETVNVGASIRPLRSGAGGGTGPAGCASATEPSANNNAAANPQDNTLRRERTNIVKLLAIAVKDASPDAQRPTSVRW
jgi:hypothetical protein